VRDARAFSPLCAAFLRAAALALHRRCTGLATPGTQSCRGKKKEPWMKKVVAIIQPSKFDAVKEALIAIGVDGMTASEARGFGRQKGHKEVFRGREYIVDLLPKIQLEIVVASERTDDVIRALISAARTGRIGDGKIFVYEVTDAVRIRNEETGDSAL
jgi:nitrogen regulatory protein P-II 1